MHVQYRSIKVPKLRLSDIIIFTGRFSLFSTSLLVLNEHVGNKLPRSGFRNVLFRSRRCLDNTRNHQGVSLQTFNSPLRYVNDNAGWHTFNFVLLRPHLYEVQRQCQILIVVQGPTSGSKTTLSTVNNRMSVWYLQSNSCGTPSTLLLWLRTLLLEINYKL